MTESTATAEQVVEPAPTAAELPPEAAQELADDQARLLELIPQAYHEMKAKSAAETAYTATRGQVNALVTKIYGEGLVRVVAGDYVAARKEIGAASVDNRKLIEAIGLDAFIALAEVGVGKVEDRLGKETAREQGIIVDGKVVQLRFEKAPKAPSKRKR